jgi:hypothetical protein
VSNEFRKFLSLTVHHSQLTTNYACEIFLVCISKFDIIFLHS